LHQRIFGTECEYASVVHGPVKYVRTNPGAETLCDHQKRLAGRLLDGAGALGIPMAGEFLGNGGRLYVDRGGHPEYATPECCSVADLVAHEIAGDRLVRDLALTLNANNPEAIDGTGRLHLYKNNVDVYGHTYGGHENYLITPQGFNDIARLLPFLVTRQMYTGAGKAMTLARDGAFGFQISQRADFFHRTYSDRTSEVRGIINTRKREISRTDQNRRLHLIIGDSNMAQYAIGLKIGTMVLMLRLLEAGALGGDVELLSPVEALKAVSGDLQAKLAVRHQGRLARYGALDLQTIYLEKALRYYAARTPDPQEALWLKHWEQVLGGFQDLNICQSNMALERDDGQLRRKVDWILKLWLLHRSRSKGATEKQLKKLDFKYHDLDPDTGLYARCMALDLVDRVVCENEIETARSMPPHNTRARLRGLVVQNTYNKQLDVKVENWERIRIRACMDASGARHGFNRFKSELNSLEVRLENPFQARDRQTMGRLQAFIDKWAVHDER
jgi:proteasome accessory factor A